MGDLEDFVRRGQAAQKAVDQVLQIHELELEAWAGITERHIAIEKAARAYVRRPTARGLRDLRAALARRVR